MTIDWFKFIAALVVLLVPSTLMHGKHVRYRLIVAEWGQYLRHVLPLGLHWIDLGRGVLGTWLLVSSITRAPNAHGLSALAPLLIQGGVFAVAVLVQTVFCRAPATLHAPFAFVTGIVLGFFDPVIGIFATLAAAVFAAGLRWPAGYFPLLSVAVLGVGMFFDGKRSELVIIAAFLPIPWLLPLLFRRPLVATYRTRRLAGPHSPHPEPGRSRPPVTSATAKN